MAWRNIWRNPRRSILTMGAVAFATLLLVFMLSWQFGSYATMINASVKIHTGHLQVQKIGYRDDQDIRKVVADPQTVGRILAGDKAVAAYTFRAEAFSLVSSKDRTYGVLVNGIDPEGEAAVSTLEETIRKGDYLSNGDTNQAIIGTLLADNLRVSLGDELVILGQGRDGSIAATVLTVKGIFNSGQDEFDRSVVHMPLDYFQDVYTMRGAVHTAVAVCTSLDAVPDATQRISRRLAEVEGDHDLVVLGWKELVPGLLQAIKMDLIIGFIFYLILIVVVAFSILNTFLMAIFERKREFGVMMAMGTTPGRLTRLLIYESAAMTILGSAAGILVGSLLTCYFQMHGIVVPGAEEFARQFGLPERIYPQLSLLSVSIGAGIVLVITLVTAAYPALRVQRMKPLEALTSA
ncbi:MAG: FtsX-like permease family protein [Desulfobacteraceae bacterium]|nr:FtsX-like permease family protein [Desulfobacteraceae bacterium]